jgi:hypothetical protein
LTPKAILEACKIYDSEEIKCYYDQFGFRDVSRSENFITKSVSNKVCITLFRISKQNINVNIVAFSNLF